MSERGAAGVEYVALLVLVAAVAIAAVATAAATRDRGTPPLAAELLRKQRCAVRYPGPCWQDPLTEAYGRRIAGVVRALAPPPRALVGPGGEPLLGVDFRRCRRPSCAAPAPGGGSRLTASNRRTAAFTAIRSERHGGPVEIDYWIYRPTLGWELVSRRADGAEIERLASTPLLDASDPMLVPLETLLGRDEARFRAGERPPWQGRVESRWGRR
jgi:hypothetical protein